MNNYIGDLLKLEIKDGLFIGHYINDNQFEYILAGKYKEGIELWPEIIFLNQYVPYVI